MSGKDAVSPGYRMADIYIDVGTRQVRRGDAVLPLPGLSFDLLLALVRRAPNVVASGDLMAEVWAGRVVNDETVAKRVELVRAALGDDSRQARYITVVRGHGYRVIAPVEPATDDRAAESAAPPDTPRASAPTPVRRALPYVIAAVLAAGVLMVWTQWPRDDSPPTATSRKPLPARPALAVLPLANLSAADASEYFADGMHDALIADLSKASGIKVISRTSTLPYRDSGKSLSAIAQELGVDLVMEGSVLRADERVRITLQLLAADDTHVWAEHYEGDLRDVLALQGNVARSVVAAVQVKLSQPESERLSAHQPVNVESYELYLEGSKLIESAKPGDFEAGIALLTRASEIDAASALPYARLALAYARRAHAPGAAKSGYPRATAYALQAIGLDPDLADAHGALAELRLYFHWDWAGAEESFRKVFELTPSFAPAHAHYGWLRVLQGDHAGALSELQQATELDPHDPVWPSWLAWVQMFNGDYLSAEKNLLAVVKRHPGAPVGWHVLGQTYLRLGRVDEALEAFQHAAKASKLWSWGVGQGLAFAGRIDEARALAKELEQAEAPDAWGLAEIYCATGDLDRAAHWIEQGYEARRDWMPWIVANTFYAPLRDHPRFREIVRRLDLPG